MKFSKNLLELEINIWEPPWRKIRGNIHYDDLPYEFPAESGLTVYGRLHIDRENPQGE